jgi:ATP-binding cassette, subfamily B, multidrug efflux pump
MIRLLKYLRPYALLLVLAVALLFIQANADLALPDYLSRIVNIGIQQGGIETAMPQGVRQITMGRMLLFMSEADQAEVLAQYTLVDSNSPDYTKDLAKYPVLASEPVYVRKPSADPAVVDRLAPVMARALLAVNGIEQAIAHPDQAASMASGMGLDLSKVSAGTDIFTLLANLPAEQRSRWMAMIEGRFAALDESMVVQAAVGPLRAETAALGVDPAGIQMAYILRTGGQMLLVSLVGVICAVLVGFLSARTAAGLARDLRRLVFRKVESFSSTEFDRFSTASLITRSTNDITQVQMVVLMMVRMVFYAPIIGVGGVIRAMSKDVSMWWIIATAVVILVVLIAVVYRVAVPKFRIMQRLIDRLNLVTRENLSGMMVVRAFNRQEAEEQRFDRANLDLTQTSLFVNRVMVIMMPMMMLIMNGLSMLIIWVGARQVAQSNMQVGDMMAFMQYAIQIVFSFLMLSMMFIFLPRADVSAHRVADVLESEAAIRDAEAPRRFPEPFSGRVEFRNVSFRYPGAEEDVLHDINFTARPGETTAILGTTGSGKSTIVSLIPRFYEVSAGAILLDGVDVRNVTQRDLRDRIGYIPQRSILFSGTIESNLRYADEHASPETLAESAEIAQAAEFIGSAPEGMGMEIAQGGANVSGGQKQRLAIARALVKRPPIYIFDDSFSSLDFKTDVALRRALKARTASSTVLIVTQRISTIKDAEQIIVLDEGRIVGQGSHAELMRDCEPYRDIALSQLSEAELR